MASRTGSIALGLTLALAVITGCGDAGDGPVSGPSSPAPAPAVSAAAPAKRQAGPPTGFAKPDKIGSLVKSADQSKAAKAEAEAEADKRVKQTAVVQYEDAADPTRTAYVLAALRADDQPVPKDADLDQMLETGKNPITVATDQVGGKARCAAYTSNGRPQAQCAWLYDPAVVLVRFDNVDVPAAAQQLPALLAAVVKH